MGNALSYHLAVPNGTYTIRLNFVEPSQSVAAGGRVFDIDLQGQTVQAGYDIVAAAGTAFKATAQTYTVTASGGSGINLSLVNGTATPAVLSGIEVYAANAGGVANPTVDLQVSPDGGTTWTTIASGLTMDAFGRGSYVWTIPTTEAPGNDYLIRAVADEGSHAQGASNQPFLIAAASQVFYVNDGSTAGAVYTTAPGNNANSGTSPDQPMANLAALLAAYDFEPGDTIYVDNGTYSLLRDVVLLPQDSGVTIVGPSIGAAVLDRGDTNTSIDTVVSMGATDVTLDQLQITGGYDGVYASNTAGSTGLTISDSTISANNVYGVYLDSGNDHATLIGNTLFGIPGNSSQGQSTGIYLASNDDTVSGNTVYQDSETGIAISNGRDDLVSDNVVYGSPYGITVSTAGNATGSDRVTVSDNTVFDNTVAGITATGSLVTGNTVYGQLSPNAVGIQADSSEVDDNLVYTNVTGISGQSSSIHGNRLYNNSSAAIFVNFSGAVFANQVYSNTEGIQTGLYYTGSIYDNLVYANTDDAILLQSMYTGGILIANNTVYQPLGNAVTIEDGTTDASLDNNILYVLAGYAIDVAPGSETGFSSDYNDLYKGINPNAHIGYWTVGGSGMSLDSLSAWNAATGTDAHSISADPDFLDIAGADNILGYALVAGAYRDGGADDNFVLDAGSPAIDSGDSWSAPPTDFLGDPRQDDPGTPNTGSPDYFGSVQSSSLFAATGAAQGWSGTNTSFILTLPFAFPSTAPATPRCRSRRKASCNSPMRAIPGSAGDPNDSDASLIANRRIAPLWADLTTSSIFVDTTVAGQVTIRWQGTNNADGSPVNFDVVLFQNGDIRFDYGAGNTNLDATVGLSYGNGWAYQVAVGLRRPVQSDGCGFHPVHPGPRLRRHGRLRVPGLQPRRHAADGRQHDPGDHQRRRHEFPVQPVPGDIQRAAQPDRCQRPGPLRTVEAGSNGFGSTDDVVYALTPILHPRQHHRDPDIDGLEDGTLPAGTYEFTIISNATSSIHDLNGNALDGDDNGTPGGDYVRTFTVTGTATTTAVTPGHGDSLRGPVGHVHCHRLLRQRGTSRRLRAVLRQRLGLRQPRAPQRRHGSTGDHRAGRQLHHRG